MDADSGRIPVADTTQSLIFSSEKKDGVLPVTDEYGRLLARVSSPRSRAHFNVTDPDGRTLCLASARWWGLGAWTVTDVDGKRMLAPRANLLKSRALIHLDRDGDLVLRGKSWGEGVTIRDAEGRSVVEAGSPPASPSAARHRGDVVLVQVPEALRLAEVISVVHIWRMATKAAVTSSAAVSTSVARGA
jgi:hypothetical protein